MTEPLQVRATSFAEDATYRATADLVSACAHIEWRLVGGVAVHLHQRLRGVTDVPDRATEDADAALKLAVGPRRQPHDQADDLRLLVDGLVGAGYEQRAGNRFVRTSESGREDRSIDLLVPAYRSTIQHSRPLADGRLRVDAVPGLTYALGPGAPPTLVDLQIEHLDRSQTRVEVPLASVRALIVVKAFAWRGRLAPKDALDIWRLLEVMQVLGEGRGDWPATGSAADARALLVSHATGLANAASPQTRTQARIRALLATHVG